MIRRAFVVAAFALIAAGCGGTPTGGAGNAGDALAYLPADAATVIFLSTDVDGEQWEKFDENVFRRSEEFESGGTFEDFAERTARDEGVSWRDDIKPLLGNDIAVAIPGRAPPLFGGLGDDRAVAALETRNGDVEEVLDKLNFREAGEANGATLYREEDDDESQLAVEGDVLVVAENEEVLREALARRDAGDGLDEDAVGEAFADLPSEYFARAFGTLAGIEEEEVVKRYASLPLVQALESWGLTVRFARDNLEADVEVALDREQLEEGDLPLVAGEESPEIVPRDTEISGANLNQSQTTVFLLRALRAGHPDSRFVRAAEAVEKELGIDFEQEILRQFNGPSASYVSAGGRTFAARSEVRDPEALAKVLPRIAPHLPALVEGLQGLQSQGMAVLFLFAPDAPAAAPMNKVRVDPPATAGGLYRISGLTGTGPRELYFGLIDDLFIVASDEQRAREIVDADTDQAPGARGAGVIRADLARLGEELGGLGTLFFFPLQGEELVASLEASTDELRARVRIELD